jgi:hypothetical protein
MKPSTRQTHHETPKSQPSEISPVLSFDESLVSQIVDKLLEIKQSDLLKVVLPVISKQAEALYVDVRTVSKTDLSLVRSKLHGMKLWKLEKTTDSWPMPDYWKPPNHRRTGEMLKDSRFIEIADGVIGWFPMPEKVTKDELTLYKTWLLHLWENPEEWIRDRNAALPTNKRVKSIGFERKMRVLHRKQRNQAYAEAREKWNNDMPLDWLELDSLISQHKISMPVRTRSWCMRYLTYARTTAFGSRVPMPVAFRERHGLWAVLEQLRKISPL